MHWRKIALLGVGLLGGSLGLDLKRLHLAGQITGYVRRKASIRDCLRFKVVDHATDVLQEAVAGADLIVFCTPLAQMAPLALAMSEWTQPGAVLTDVGSVKCGVIQELEPICAERGLHFVGSHPMAGGELMGVAAARPKLFDGATCVVTPTPSSNASALESVEHLWRSVGGMVKRLPPGLHDQYVGRTSHLPHVVASALANYVLSPAHDAEQSSLCSTGFRDTTRVASGSPEMWRDIVMANKDHLARSLGVLIEDLTAFREVVESGNGPALHEFFSEAKKRRDAWLQTQDAATVSSANRTT